jgi:hypothetical protein
LICRPTQPTTSAISTRATGFSARTRPRLFGSVLGFHNSDRAYNPAVLAGPAALRRRGILHRPLQVVEEWPFPHGRHCRPLGCVRTFCGGVGLGAGGLRRTSRPRPISGSLCKRAIGRISSCCGGTGRIPS